MDISKFPKSKELLRKDTVDSLTLFVAAFPVGSGFDKEFITDELIDNTQRATLENNPRHLYDFFDKNGIIIGIYPSWKFGINDIEYDPETRTRTEIEALAFEKAFELLEAKL